MPNNFSLREPSLREPTNILKEKARAAMPAQRVRPVLHYWTTVVYGLIGITLFMLPIAFSNYKITYQALLVGTNFIPLGLLIGMNIQEDGYQQRRLRTVFCISLFVAVGFTIYASIEPISFLTNKCSDLQQESFEPPSHHHHEKYLDYLWTRSICQNEYGFIIVYLIYMSIIFLISVISLFVYAFRMSYP